MRLPNGYGTVYKLKGNRRHPWVAGVPDGIKNDRYTYRIIGYFEDSIKARDALTLNRISPVSPKANITLEEIYKEWSTAKYEYISDQTADSYKAGWKHLSKYANVKFKELRTAHHQDIIDTCFKSGMSRSSLEKIKVVAKMLYDYAIQNDIVNRNYAVFIKLPKVERVEKKIFTDIEIQKLENSDLPWVDTVLILIYTGLRINEFLSLTKFNIDLGKQVITGGLKTPSGRNRVIPIHPKILKHINYWYEKNGNYLICDNEGKHIYDKDYREDYYYTALKSAGVNELTPHCCRHTFASLMHKAGIDTITIQKLMGHTKYSFTADTYTHTNIEQLKNAISLI
jgi:integrase